MGLDAYMKSVDDKNLRGKQVDFMVSEANEPTEIAYWRKCRQLQGWMRDLYIKKGGKYPEFNCSPVRLMTADLNRLERAALSGELAKRDDHGFFWGGFSLENDDVESIVIACARAKLAISRGQVVYYSAWY